MHEHDIDAAETTRQLQDSNLKGLPVVSTTPSRNCSGMGLRDGDQYCNSRVQSKICSTNRSEGQHHVFPVVPDCRIEPVSQGSPLSCAAPRTSSCFGDHRSCMFGLHCIYSVVPRSCMLSPVTICQCDPAYRNNGKTSYRALRPSRDGCSVGVTVTTLTETQVAANQASDRNSNNCRFGSQSIDTKPRVPAGAVVNTARSIYPRQ